jgi:outer membrane lipoprotein carrier protein
MKMNKLISMMFIMLLAGFAAHGQNDKKATKILDGISEKTKASKTIRIDFAYTMFNKKDNINDKFSGVLLSKGDKYRLTVAGQEVFCDGKTIWTYLKEAKEVNISSSGDGEEGFTPTKLLSDYAKDYKAKFIKELGNNQLIELTPVAKGKSFTKIGLTIDKTRQQVTQFQIFDRGGSVFTYIVNKWITDQPIDDKQFIFNKASYPGVGINDMR